MKYKLIYGTLGIDIHKNAKFLSPVSYIPPSRHDTRALGSCAVNPSECRLVIRRLKHGAFHSNHTGLHYRCCERNK
jgi:hypothetical protein